MRGLQRTRSTGMWLRDRAPEYTFQLAIRGNGDLADHARDDHAISIILSSRGSILSPAPALQYGVDKQQRCGGVGCGVEQMSLGVDQERCGL